MKLRRVFFAQQVPIEGSSYPVLNTATPNQDGETFEAFAPPEWFPWVILTGTKGRKGVTTMFNIVSRGFDEADLAAMTRPEAPEVPDSKPAPQSKRGG